MCISDKCVKICGSVFLVLGILFLLRDLNMWDFWNIQWWTALFLVMGIGCLSSLTCPECKAIRTGKKK